MDQIVHFKFRKIVEDNEFAKECRRRSMEVMGESNIDKFVVCHGTPCMDACAPVEEVVYNPEDRNICSHNDTVELQPGVRSKAIGTRRTIHPQSSKAKELVILAALADRCYAGTRAYEGVWVAQWDYRDHALRHLQNKNTQPGVARFGRFYAFKSRFVYTSSTQLIYSCD